MADPSNGEVTDLAGATPNATRARILEAGIACFTRYGNDRTTLQDVAAKAGVARNTVYRYFADRNELGEAVRVYEYERMAREFANRTPDVDNLAQAIAALVTIMHDTSERYRLREHLQDHDLGQLGAWHSLRASDARFVRDALASHVDQAFGSGQLATGLQPDEALDWIVVAISAIGFVDVASADPKDGAAVAHFYATNVTRGVMC